jgi:hypothetical protein
LKKVGFSFSTFLGGCVLYIERQKADMEYLIVGSLSIRYFGETGKCDNIVLSSSCDMPPEVSVRNIKLFYNVFEEYNKKNK